MRRLIALIVGSVAASAFAQSPTSFQFQGVVAVRGIYVKSQPSWTQHGIGRFDVGADDPDDSRTTNVDIAQLGFDWTPARWLLIHADGIARHEPSGTVGKKAGIVQAFADLFTERLRLRAGAFWLPTSRENVDPMWNSRYTITYSALNSWIAQEVRPLGADLQFSPNFYFTIGATAFRSNDTMGTVLADRGWTLGNRLSVYNDIIAVPPADLFTKAIGAEIDHRTGFSERIRIQLPERALLQVTHVDNRTKPAPGKAPEVPWDTTFNVVSAEAGSQSPVTIAGEWAKGKTTVGFPGGTFSLDFSTAYLLVSRKYGANRYTTRIEQFSTRSHLRFPNDSSREDGDALTVAWLHDASDHLRTSLEYVRVTGADRPGAAAVGLNPRTRGSMMTAEIRYRW